MLVVVPIPSVGVVVSPSLDEIEEIAAIQRVHIFYTNKIVAVALLERDSRAILQYQSQFSISETSDK